MAWYYACSLQFVHEPKYTQYVNLIVFLFRQFCVYYSTIHVLYNYTCIIL